MKLSSGNKKCKMQVLCLTEVLNPVLLYILHLTSVLLVHNKANIIKVSKGYKLYYILFSQGCLSNKTFGIVHTSNKHSCCDDLINFISLHSRASVKTGDLIKLINATSDALICLL